MPDLSSASWPQADITSSPSRTLCDLFWRQLSWETIESALGAIKILDTGCGSGTYAPKLSRCAGGRIASYAGVDRNAHGNWNRLSEENPRWTFREMDSDEISADIVRDANLLISQSAVEHFENDLSYFKCISTVVHWRRTETIQIHLMPSASCLELYRFHGVRQYTPRTISCITRLFGEESCCTLYSLGGNECNRLHLEYVTKPVRLRGEDLRQTRTQEYTALLRDAIAEDSGMKSGESSFYALVIHSYGNRKILNLVPGSEAAA